MGGEAAAAEEVVDGGGEGDEPGGLTRSEAAMRRETERQTARLKS